MTQPRPIDETTLEQAVAWLCARDADLAEVVGRHGPPPLWRREPGFETLVRIILEQQVSLASGLAAYDRLELAAASVTPAVLAGMDPAILERAGVTRQKSRYLRGLAATIIAGDLDLEGLAGLDDHDARSSLSRVPGIGPWTADVYLLMALGRPDVWPATDIALVTSIRDVKGLAGRPGPGEMERLAEPWRPWRAVVARILWHAYLEARATAVR